MSWFNRAPTISGTRHPYVMYVLASGSYAHARQVGLAILLLRGRAMFRVIEYFAKSLKVIRNDTVKWGVCKSLSVFHWNYVCVSYRFWDSASKNSVTLKPSVGLIHAVSRSLKTAPFDRPYTTFYWSASTNIALSCIVFELFDVE